LVKGSSAGDPPKKPGKDESETTGSIHGCRNGSFFSVYDDFDKILSEFMAMSAEM
jgi:hypothetical protein